MEFEIGQIIEFIYNGKNITVKIEEGNNCKECVFNTNRNCSLSNAYCTSIKRKDKKNIIYKQIK